MLIPSQRETLAKIKQKGRMRATGTQRITPKAVLWSPHEHVHTHIHTHIKKNITILNYARWCICLIPAFRKPRHEDLHCEASLDYVANLTPT